LLYGLDRLARELPAIRGDAQAGNRTLSCSNASINAAPTGIRIGIVPIQK
jgi:hypothetical protein